VELATRAGAALIIAGLFMVLMTVHVVTAKLLLGAGVRFEVVLALIVLSIAVIIAGIIVDTIRTVPRAGAGRRD
jgi:hypothetical protein